MLLMNNKKAQEYFVAPKLGFVNAPTFCKHFDTKTKGFRNYMRQNDMRKKAEFANTCRKCAPGPNFDDFKKIIGVKLSILV